MGCELTSAEEIQMEQVSLSSSVLDLSPAGYYLLSYMHARHAAARRFWGSDPSCGLNTVG